MWLRPRLARLICKVSGWRLVGECPREGLVVGAPHTSYWDFVLMLLVMWNDGVPPRVLVKQEMFHGPTGWLLRTLGGIPVDRENPGRLVAEIVQQARSGKPFLLVIAAEGTRKATTYWKSGFYRIARDADLPVVLAFCDGPTRTTGVGPAVRLTGDVVADMDVVRAFYADKRGINPERRTEPRLREEDAARGS